MRRESQKFDRQVAAQFFRRMFDLQIGDGLFVVRRTPRPILSRIAEGGESKIREDLEPLRSELAAVV
uniref:Uncharacterized protein n=1 Tax=Romanomermis culicivorax TaxID=13658 RepID=A0A915IQW2_ROMCU